MSVLPLIPLFCQSGDIDKYINDMLLKFLKLSKPNQNIFFDSALKSHLIEQTLTKLYPIVTKKTKLCKSLLFSLTV